MRTDFEKFSQDQKILNEKYEQAVENVGTKADKDGNNIDVDKYKKKLGLDTLNKSKADKKEFEEERERSKTADKELENTIETEISARIKEGLEQNEKIGINSEAIEKHNKKIERLDDEKANYKYVDSVRDASKAALDKEKKEREKKDEELEKSLVDTYNGLNNRLLNEVDSRAKEDAKLATKIKQNKEAIADNKKAIEANKDAVQSEIVDRTKADLAEENARKAADKKHDAAIDTNKKAIDAEVTRSTAADKKHDAAIADNKKAIGEIKATDKKYAEAIAANKAGIEANASAIKHLDSKLNKTTAMMTAMNNVDFQDVNVGEVAIGAGVGHFVGDQAVAVGVLIGVNDDLKVHAKWSGVAGDPHYNAIGGGVTYKFRTR